MAVFETWLRNDLKKPVKVKQLEGNLFSADNGGNLIGVEVMNNGQAASLSGGVTGYIIRADGQTVVINGSLSGNRASITLPTSAYVVVGQISIVIKVGTTTVGACTGYVYRTTTDAIVDPGHVIPSLEELLAQIANCIAATSAANTAAGAANTAAGSANTAAGAANTAAGTANTAAGAANTAASGATSAAGSANSAATAATTAAGAANTAAGKIDNMTVAAQAGAEPGATISEVDGHKHILFTLKQGDKGDKGDKGDRGKDFEFRKTFASIAQMEAYDPETDPSAKKVRENDVVMIDTGSVQDVDTGKIFCYEPDTIDVWRYIGDLSGSQGIKGETGTGIANIVLNQDYTLTITMDDGHTSYTTASIRGAQGQQGIAGVSPTVTVTTITGGHQVSITDATGTNTFDVMDGADGQDGADGADGQNGTNAYVHIRYSHNQPTQDSDMGTTADDWIGIYSGDSSTAPTTYTSYTWYKIKGETGSAANVYGTTIPMSDQDATKVATAIQTKLDALEAAAAYDNTATYAEGAYCFHGGLKKCTTAITTAEEWTAAHWTSTTIAAELSTKVNLYQGSGNAGKALGIDQNGFVVPVPFSGEDFTGATAQAAGTHGYVPAPAAGNQNKFLKGDGTWGDVPNPSDMGGATAQAAGSHGLAPAPAAGDQAKFLRGDGTWADTPYPGTMTGATASTAGSAGLVPAPAAGDQEKVLMADGTWKISPGLKKYPVTITVTNTSGAYDHTFSDLDTQGIDVVTADMTVDRIEVGNREAFDGDLHFFCGAGTIRLVCDSVSGTSTIVCWVQKQITDPTTMTSTEFDLLNNRLTAVENVETNYAITIPTSGWTLSNGVYKYTWMNSTITAKTSVDFDFLDEAADTDTIGIEKITGGVEFTAAWIPEAAIGINIKVTYARNSDIAEITGDMVATDAITGAENVDEALSSLEDKLIKSYTKQFTSNTNGDIVTDLPATKIVIAAHSSNTSCYVAGTYNDNWVITLLTHGSGTANIVTRPSTETVLTLYYFDP